MARRTKETPGQAAVDIADLTLGEFEGESRDWQEGPEAATVSGKVRREITSLAELVDFFRIDLEVWEVERWVANQWQQASVDRVKGGIHLTPLYQVKAWLKKRTAAIAARDEIADTLEAARRAMRSKPWRRSTPPRKSRTAAAFRTFYLLPARRAPFTAHPS